MLKYFIPLIFFSLSLQAQSYKTLNDTISIKFNNQTYEGAFSDIENSTGIKIYYASPWLPDKLINRQFNHKSVTEILNEILEETNLNVYLYNSKSIILTKNNLVYDRLPEGFFGKYQEKSSIENYQDLPKQANKKNTLQPLFYSSNPSNKQIETIKIGKQRANTKKTYKLTGYVINKNTKEPISNLSLIIDGRGTGSVTNEDGYYELSLPAGENIIKTRSLSNENVTKRIIIYSGGSLDFRLDDSFEMLSEVRLTTNLDKNINNTNTGEEKIDVENIKNIPLALGERDIMKVAATLPGISKAGEGSSGYNVRGGKEDQNLILLDDAVMYNPSHFFGLFSAVNPFTTGGVTIFKGNIPAKYGGRLSSVFDLTTKNGNTEEFEGEASLGPVTSNLALEVPIVKEKSSVIVGARSTYSDWILKKLDEESLKNSTAFFYDAIIKYYHKFNDKNKISATGYLSEDRFSISNDSVHSYNNALFSLHYNHKFSDKSEGTLIATNSNYKFNILYESNFEDNFESGYEINETNLKLDLNNKYIPKHNLNYGISGKLYQIKPGYKKPIGNESSIKERILRNEKAGEYAVWLADNFELSDKLSFNAGLRYSFFTSFGSDTIRTYDKDLPKNNNTVVDQKEYSNYEIIKTYGGPEVRLSARLYLLPDTSVKASYNNTLQYIHTLSNNTTVSPTDTYRLSGYHLKPQRANQYSLGFYKNFKENTIETSIEGYYKTSNNTLDFKTGANLFLNDYVETEVLQGEGKSYGVEFLLKKKTGKLNGWLSYTYSRSYLKLQSNFREETVNNGDYFPANYDKPHNLAIVANYKLTRRFSFSGNFTYQSGRPITYPVGKYNYDGSDYVLYSDRNQFRIPDYYRLDLGFNLEGNHKLKKIGHSFWNFSVYNVLGRNNPYSVYFVTKEGKIEGRKSSIFSVPIPSISFNFKF
ncbi:TonB-dependent receptor [Zunongwangia sp.]|uniref:TonB-dependent receptor n=1 Tax=Zunongwangia sp. TaxID=1965325 RepID=UPI003AA8420A